VNKDKRTPFTRSHAETRSRHRGWRPCAGAAPGLRWTEATAERLGEIEDALAERLGGQERLEELAGSLEGLMALAAEPIPTRAGSARNSARTS
jgi:hypothetical protein